MANLSRLRSKLKLLAREDSLLIIIEESLTS